MKILNSIGPEANVAVIGASGGIGGGLCQALANCDSVASLHALSRRPGEISASKVVASEIDIGNEDSVEAAAARTSAQRPLDLVIVATGILHRGEMQPEKSMAQIDGENLVDVFRINTVGPALVAKHFLPRLSRDRKSAFAVLSARVGSIGDNRLGGWYAYRASKAAVNMMLKTLSIEHARRFPDSIITALHPGTVDTALSEPFSGRVPENKLFSTNYSAERLLQVIDGLDAEDTGGFFAWDGSAIPW